MRYLTARLGQFLEVGPIQIIALEQIAVRYVVDLNLPSKFLLFKSYQIVIFQNLSN